MGKLTLSFFMGNKKCYWWTMGIAQVRRGVYMREHLIKKLTLSKALLSCRNRSTRLWQRIRCFPKLENPFLQASTWTTFPLQSFTWLITIQLLKCFQINRNECMNRWVWNCVSTKALHLGRTDDHPLKSHWNVDSLLSL